MRRNKRIATAVVGAAIAAAGAYGIFVDPTVAQALIDLLTGLLGQGTS